MVYSVVLNIDGEINDEYLDIEKKKDIISQSKTILTSKGTNKFDIIGNWEDENGHVIFYGWSMGKNNVNKSYLPPPLNDTIFYGDILIISEKENKLCDFRKDDYINFYNLQYGGDDNSVKDLSSDEESIYSEEPITENEEKLEDSISCISDKIDDLSSDELQLEDYDTDEFNFD